MHLLFCNAAQVNDFGDCVGILTRAELTEDHILHCTAGSDVPERRDSLITSGYPGPLSSVDGFAPIRPAAFAGDDEEAGRGEAVIEANRARTAVRIPVVRTVSAEVDRNVTPTGPRGFASWNQIDRMMSSDGKDGSNPLQ